MTRLRWKFWRGCICAVPGKSKKVWKNHEQYGMITAERDIQEQRENMNYDLQKAGLWKRLTAGLFDGILTAILAVGFGFLLSLILGFDGYTDALNAGYEAYETQYGVSFQLTQEDYGALTPAVQQRYDEAYQALMADKEVLYNYNMTVNLSLVITTVGILLAVLLIELAVPLFLGNGQTLGKKIFGICLMRTDSVRINNLQLFTRALLGKFTIETMIPVNLMLMIFLGLMDVTGTMTILSLLLFQCVSYFATRNNSLIHDLLAGTVVVDYASQKIFASPEELVEFQKQIAAERAARQSY